MNSIPGQAMITMCHGAILHTRLSGFGDTITIVVENNGSAKRQFVRAKEILRIEDRNSIKWPTQVGSFCFKHADKNELLKPEVLATFIHEHRVQMRLNRWLKNEPFRHLIDHVAGMWQEARIDAGWDLRREVIHVVDDS
jgi:hypothetical protein